MLIGPIDLAIKRYAFCGSGGANLHTKFSETYRSDHFLNYFNVFFDPQNMGVAYTDTLIVPLYVILNKL